MENTVSVMGMPGVGVLGFLVIGFLAGWIAERSMNRDHGFLTNIVVGVLGSFLGGFLAGLLNVNYYGFWGNLIVAAVGAIILLWIFGRVRSRG